VGVRSLDSFLHRAPEELYDLSRDPNEVHSLVSDPVFREQLQQFREDMLAFRKQTQDPWLPGEASVFDHRAH